MSASQPKSKPPFKIHIEEMDSDDEDEKRPDIVINPFLKTPPMSNRASPTPVAQTPAAKTPTAKAPVLKTPVAQLPAGPKPAGTKVRTRRFFPDKRSPQIEASHQQPLKTPPSRPVKPAVPKSDAQVGARRLFTYTQRTPRAVQQHLKSPAASPKKSGAQTARIPSPKKPVASSGAFSARTPREGSNAFMLNSGIALIPEPPKAPKSKSKNKAAQLMGADEKDTDHILERKNFRKIIVNFYDPGNVFDKKVFGHIAVEVFYDLHNDKASSSYYSYGESGEATLSSSENDITEFTVKGVLPNRYQLSMHKPENMSDKQFALACKTLADKPRGAGVYNRFDNNCLHAVMEFLQNAKYPIKDTRKNTRPKAGMEHFIELNLKWIGETRDKIKATPYADAKIAIQQMKDLLDNDIERLQTDIVSAKLTKHPDIEANAKLEIILLEKLKEKLNRLPIPFVRIFEELCSRVTYEPKSIDEKKLLDCLNKFPVDQLSKLNEKKDFLLAFTELRSNPVGKKAPVPMEVRAWARKISETNLNKLSALEIHRLAFHVKQTLQNLANDGKWFAEANKWLGKLDPAAKVSVPKTPKAPFK